MRAAIVATGLLLFVTASSNSHAVDAGGVRVVGTYSCGEWATNDSKTKDPMTMFATGLRQRWLMGFLSGAAWGTGKNILSDTDAPSVFLWMDNWCRANPLKSIDEGAEQLVHELVKLKHL